MSKPQICDRSEQVVHVKLGEILLNKVKRGWRVSESILSTGLVPNVIRLKLFLDHSGFQSVEVGNAVTRISL